MPYRDSFLLFSFKDISCHGDPHWASPADRHSKLYDQCGAEPGGRGPEVSRGPHTHAASPHEGSARDRPQWLQQVHGESLFKTVVDCVRACVRACVKNSNLENLYI